MLWQRNRMRMVWKFILTWVFFSMALPQALAVTIVVNANNPVDSISRNDLSQLFLKKKRYWPDGSLVRFIDRKKGQSEREVFLSNILAMSQRELDQYWVGRKLYGGDSAPLQADTDTMALRLVQQLEGAVSYVSNPELIKNFKVKPLRVTD